MTPNNLGEKIASLRKQLSLTQEQLAEKLGVTSQAVSKWETGITSPDISLLPALSEVFFITVDELLGISKKATIANQSDDTSKLLLRIKILSSDGDIVNVNLPFPIVLKAIEMGIAGSSFGITGNNAVKDIDWSQLADAVKMGLRGKIVDIKSADGDIVEIVVE